MKTAFRKAKNHLSQGLATQHPVKLSGGLVLGALLFMGTAFYMAPGESPGDSNDATTGSATEETLMTGENHDNLASSEIRWEIEQPVEVIEFFGQGTVAALGHELLDAKLNHYQADGPLTSRRLERLDYEIDMLLLNAAPLPSASGN